MSSVTDEQLRAAGVGEPAIALFRGRRVVPGPSGVATGGSDHTLTAITTRGNTLLPAAGPLTLVLPWSCLVSDNRHRGPVTSRADSAAYKLARTRAHAEAREQWGPRAPFKGRVALSIVFTPPRLGRPDPTNLLKALLDALGATRDEPGVCYHDDGQIDILHVERAAPNVDRPRAEITVEEIGT